MLRTILGWSIFLAGLILLSWLAYWQLERADEKRALIEQSAARLKRAPVSLQRAEARHRSRGLGVVSEVPIFTVVSVSGHWLNRPPVYLDNQVRQGKTGYNVLSLFLLDGGGSVVVDRGWRAFTNPALRGFEAFPNPDRVHQLVGYLYYSGPYRFSEAPQQNTQGQRIVTGFDTAHSVQIFPGLPLDKRVKSLVLRQWLPESRQGLKRDWPIVNMTPERHLGYALQWAVMALVWCILNFTLWRRRRTAARDTMGSAMTPHA